jgi:phage terminase large subunit
LSGTAQSQRTDVDLKIEFILQPKEDLLRWYVEESHKVIIGFGGSRGGAKSHGSRSVGLKYAWEHSGSRVLILRRKYKELKENHIDPLFAEHPQLRQFYNVSDKILSLPNGAALVFWHAETFSDLKSLQGGGYNLILVDEATHFHQHELEWLQANCRGLGKSVTVYTCNPGDVGHSYIQRVCVDRKDYRDKEKPEQYAFIQSYAWDNAHWSILPLLLDKEGLTEDDYERMTPREKWLAYARMSRIYHSWTDKQRFDYFISRTAFGAILDGLNPDLRPGWLLGLWTKFAGQYFTNFSRERHVAKRLPGGTFVCPISGKEYKIEAWWPKWLAQDWGFADDSATEWGTTAPDGRHIVYREWVTNNVTPRMLGAGLLERSIDHEGRPERFSQFFLSPDAFDDDTGQETIAEGIRETACVGNRLPSPAEASNARVSGWQCVYSLFETNGILISEECRVLIAALPTLTRFGYGEGNVEDIKESKVDHAPDALRYLMFSRLGTITAPKEVRAAKKVEGVTDPTQRAIILDQFHADEAKRNQPIPLAGRHGGKRRWRPGG